MRSYVSQRTPQIETEIDHWNEGTVLRWDEISRAMVAWDSLNPPRAARALALVSVAMYDAMVAAWDAKYAYRRPRPYEYPSAPQTYGTLVNTPSFVSERAAIGGAALTVLKYLYPSKSDSLSAIYDSSCVCDLYAGVHFSTDVTEGTKLGFAVGAAVVARAEADHSDITVAPTPPVGPGYWVPTPPAYKTNPTEPGAGQWTTWIIPAGAAVRPGPPPAFGTPEFDAQVTEVWQTWRDLTYDRYQMAVVWEDGLGTFGPPGRFNLIGCEMGHEHEWSEPRMARMLALLGTAQADAFIACWDAKYVYWTDRPITEVRRMYDPLWLSPITTPAFPAYPSGHSTTAGAAAVILSYLFPDQAVDIQQMALEDMVSRLYGGVHYSVDNYTGFGMGSAIGLRAIQIAEHDGSQ